jgi:hypothetical protein
LEKLIAKFDWQRDLEVFTFHPQTNEVDCFDVHEEKLTP